MCHAAIFSLIVLNSIICPVLSASPFPIYKKDFNFNLSLTILTRSLWTSGFGLTRPFFSHSFVIFNNSPMSLLKNLSNSNFASQSFSSAHSVVLMRCMFPSWLPWFNSGSAESGETCFSSSASPNNWPKRNLAQTIQWIGSVGVFRIVQPGNVFCRGFGWIFFYLSRNRTYEVRFLFNIEQLLKFTFGSLEVFKNGFKVLNR